jgi:hypothetical protein
MRAFVAQNVRRFAHDMFGHKFIAAPYADKRRIANHGRITSDVAARIARPNDRHFFAAKFFHVAETVGVATSPSNASACAAHAGILGCHVVPETQTIQWYGVFHHLPV